MMRRHVLPLIHWVSGVQSAVDLQPGRLAEHDACGARGTLQKDRLLVGLALLHLVPVLEAVLSTLPSRAAGSTISPLKSTGVS